MEWPPQSGEDGELFDEPHCLAQLSAIHIDMDHMRWVAELRTAPVAADAQTEPLRPEVTELDSPKNVKADVKANVKDQFLRYSPDHIFTLQTWNRLYQVTVSQIDPATIGPQAPAWPIISGVIVSQGDLDSTVMLRGDEPTIPM